MTYVWLLFDADGTLFDFELAEVKALESSFAHFHLPYDLTTAEIYHKINRQVWMEFEQGRITAEALRLARFERLFAVLQLPGDHHPFTPSSFSDVYLKGLSATSDLLEEAEAVVRVLKKRYRLAIITNGLKDVQRPRLANSALARDFEVIAISEEMGVAKPHPRFFELTFEQLGQPHKDQVLVIGDSLASDILGGINFGLDTCWYNPRDLPGDARISPKFQIHQLNELLTLL